MMDVLGLSVAALAAAGLLAVSSAGADLRLPALLGDNAIIQRGVPAPVWGYGRPGARVSVGLAGQTRTAVVGRDGRWHVRLSPMPAGGPYRLTVAGDGVRLEASNIMVGDVWVASGQSNMVWPLVEARNGRQEVAAANAPELRLFALKRDAAASPRDNCEGKWEPCSPGSVSNFSAVAYYFGRALQRRLRVPIGLIQSDVGGTPAESWCAPEWLRGDPDFADLLEKTPPKGAAAPVGQAEYERTMNEWYLSVLMQDPGNRGEREGWCLPNAPVPEWRPMRVPGAWETAEPPLSIDGAVWFRRSVTVPAEWAGRDLILSLGTIADHDVTYWSGERIGATQGPMPTAGVARSYRIPARLVRAGSASIAVRVWNQIAAGGFTGQPAEMQLGLADGSGSLPLAGEWLYRVELSREAASVPPMPSPPTDRWTAWSTGGLYNAMVAPLTRCAVKGVIWYQGESNVGRAEQYRKLFPTLVRGWRTAWGQGDLPFLFVQLANFNPRKAEPSESDWAELREAQAAALALPNTGMAVAIDVGDAADIHPKDKRPVGERLALAALRAAYDERRVIHSGPVPDRVTVNGSSVIVRFKHAGDGLTTSDGGPVRGFALAGADGRFAWAQATISGSAVTLSCPEVGAPVAVRYAWADNPECNLCSKAGLPAAPFRADLGRPAAGRVR